MTFFNRKEEVIEVQLTRQGREKLAMGKFKPASYEFLDEDVLYEKRSGTPEVVEEQNEIKKRIKEKLTLREPTARQAVVPYNKNRVAENRQIEGLGTFIPYSNYRPAWKIEAEDGFLFTGSGDISFTPVEVEKGGSKGPSYEKIPQMNLTCSYNYHRVAFDKTDTTSQFYADVQENPFIDFDDIFRDDKDNIAILFNKSFNDFTISVEEENVLNGKEDFILEVFKYKYNDNYQTASLERLYFDDEDINSESVGWYFNITTDEEVAVAKEGFTFVDEDIVVEKVDDECLDLSPTTTTNLVNSTTGVGSNSTQPATAPVKCERDSDCGTGRCSQGFCV